MKQPNLLRKMHQCERYLGLIRVYLFKQIRICITCKLSWLE